MGINNLPEQRVHGVLFMNKAPTASSFVSLIPLSRTARMPDECNLVIKCRFSSIRARQTWKRGELDFEEIRGGSWLSGPAHFLCNLALAGTFLVENSFAIFHTTRPRPRCFRLGFSRIYARYRKSSTTEEKSLQLVAPYSLKNEKRKELSAAEQKDREGIREKG